MYQQNLCQALIAASLLHCSAQFSQHPSPRKKPPFQVAFGFAAKLASGGKRLAKAYFSKASTLCCDWLAWANMAVAACEMICALAKLVDSLA